MSLTVPQLKNLPFDYLSGGDLIRYSAPQLLIKQYEVDPDSLDQGCKIAYSELKSQLNTRWNLVVEFEKRGFTNAAAFATTNGVGEVNSINIIYGGTNYGTAPIVVITGTGSGAAATATVENGVVTGFNITNPGS